MSEVTQVLSAIEQGDPHAAEQLLPLVYEELRRLAAHGINSLWLIGVWERSSSSQTIKQLCGNQDAVASAGLRSESEGEEPNRRVVVFPVS